MVDLVYCLANLLFLDIPLLYYSINIRASIIYVSLSDLFCLGLFDIFVILSAILFRIKLPVASAVFSITLFEIVLSATVADYLA